ncbi:Nucleotidyl transferase AbiEii toxin, Type IV TA system [Paractinoplanes atraurantiacus]|uniref:Nucleotidyl transferase AbiEii toxin, Type IV TA system n=1 Tax=Paractinoplanes atraurantiacus TaxID=1036182 RepID=A0A285GWX5_9ACTN|nr:nucleotidyl transferase AbiEii/AbiGii toxin family protein [Actinoplanes atraurantiacus]SNY28170.1 Nucleotidyl transferase AbiEii toxin, Type IV TA system [Actinoplanes atraurantiacus]
MLHPDDAVANKMCALFGRAEARDFLDVDAAIQSGRYTRERLLDLAAAADGGFDRARFADAIGSLRRITDADFDLYGASAEDLAAVRARFADWHSELRS